MRRYLSMTVEEVVKLVGSPDYVIGDAWEFDTAGEAPATLVIEWKANRVWKTRKLPAKWQDGWTRDHVLHFQGQVVVAPQHEVPVLDALGVEVLAPCVKRRERDIAGDNLMILAGCSSQKAASSSKFRLSVVKLFHSSVVGLGHSLGIMRSAGARRPVIRSVKTSNIRPSQRTVKYGSGPMAFGQNAPAATVSSFIPPGPVIK